MRKKYDDPLFNPPKRKRHWFLFVLFFLFAFCGLILGINYLYNAQPVLVSQNITLPSLSGGFEGYKILHISDLHGVSFGLNQENLLSVLKDKKYDIVCLTGDVTDNSGSVKSLIRLIQQFSENIPILFVPGDEDPVPVLSPDDIVSSAKASYILELEQEGVIFLDAPYAVHKNKQTLWFMPESLYSLDLEGYSASISQRLAELMGNEDEYSQASLIAAQYHEDRLKRILEAKQQMMNEDIHVILSHIPLNYESFADLMQISQEGANPFAGKIVLSLAGHINAGQWQIPFLNTALYVPQTFGTTLSGFFVNASVLSGIHSSMGIIQYISPGLANSRLYPFPIRIGRLFVKPTVTILNLTTKLY